MLALERIHDIEHLIRQHGKVTVQELAQKYNVSPDLIRKDLKKLQLENDSIKRVHGGAVFKHSTSGPASFEIRRKVSVEEKKEIAKYACTLIEPHFTIFLDNSSTCLRIAEELNTLAFPVTVITNMLEVIYVLKQTPMIDLILIGGTYNASLDGCVDQLARNQLDYFNIDVAFVGTGGINIQTKSLTIYELEEGYMKKKIIDHSKKSYVVFTSERFSDEGRFSFAHLHDISGVITDSNVDHDIISAFQAIETSLLFTKE